MQSARSDLIDVLSEARALLARASNNFSWSSWGNADAALAEIDGLAVVLYSGGLPPKLDLQVIFAATGPLQEVSLSSGWSQEFIVLAERCDAALARLFDSHGKDG